MKEIYNCKHGTTELLIGSDHGCYCNQCKSLIYSDKDKIKIKEQEMSLNYDEQK